MHEGACHLINGSASREGFYGDWRRQVCTTGGWRDCQRCTQIQLQPQADTVGWGLVTVRSKRVEAAPVDCTQACPADEWTPLLPWLTTVLAGRTFAGVLKGEGPTVFRSARGCARGDATGGEPAFDGGRAPMTPRCAVRRRTPWSRATLVAPGADLRGLNVARERKVALDERALAGRREPSMESGEGRRDRGAGAAGGQVTDEAVRGRCDRQQADHAGVERGRAEQLASTAELEGGAERLLHTGAEEVDAVELVEREVNEKAAGEEHAREPGGGRREVECARGGEPRRRVCAQPEGDGRGRDDGERTEDDPGRDGAVRVDVGEHPAEHAEAEAVPGHFIHVILGRDPSGVWAVA